ncbi:MAG: chorismate synthase [Nitrospirae bacterium]|nr:chorismate synthase [Nitrospirota bacterium]
MIRFLTAGESHGQLLMGIIEGIPSGLDLTADDINKDLSRRQMGYGRGGRMRIEKDSVEITCGVRWGKTLGSPVGLLIKNRDWVNWSEKMSPDPTSAGSMNAETKPRPGHADLQGIIKYSHSDTRNVLERASARETAMRVAIGGVAKKFLNLFGIDIISHVVELGNIKIKPKDLPPNAIMKIAESSELRCIDKKAETQMKKLIDNARKKGDSVGGIFEVIITNPPVGLGSYSQWDKRINARLAYSLMSIQAIKGVEVGLGFDSARTPGSEVHDPIYYDKKAERFYRKTNRAGGIEGGITNGENIILRAAMKPIATLYAPLESVDIKTKKPFKASIERSDICAVPAASVVGEAMTAIEMANAILEKFGGDSVEEVKRNYLAYMEYVKKV